jgi:predicted short-subunit dehydrogenase-like oxidoreductase (DUF2520 family)
MRIGLIGCGRVGVTLFYYLKRQNEIIGVYDTSRRNEGRARKILGIKENPNYTNLVQQSEALFLATPDDVIRTAYRRMRIHLHGPKYVYHFSGVLPAGIIPRRKNVYRASIHPFATFPTIVIPPKTKRYHLSIEGDEQAIKAARSIFSSRYFTLRKIDRTEKALYHLIGVFSSNLLIGLLASIYDMAGKLRWTEKDIRQLVYPIIEETFRNVKDTGLLESLTGPLQRGDVATIERHVKVLQHDRKLLKIYKSLSMYILHNVVPGKKNRRLEKLLGQ